MLLVPDGGMALAPTAAGTLAVALLGGAAAGLVIGIIFGLLLGRGTADLDEHLYARSVQSGQILMLVHAEEMRAHEASRIMQHANLVAQP